MSLLTFRLRKSSPRSPVRWLDRLDGDVKGSNIVAMNSFLMCWRVWIFWCPPRVSRRCWAGILLPFKVCEWDLPKCSELCSSLYQVRFWVPMSLAEWWWRVTWVECQSASLAWMIRLSLKNRAKGLRMKRGKGKRHWSKSHLPLGMLVKGQHLIAFLIWQTRLIIYSPQMLLLTFLWIGQLSCELPVWGPQYRGLLYRFSSIKIQT